MAETPEQAAFRGRDAKRLLDDPLLKAAFEAVGKRLEDAALACDRKDAEQALSLCISKQLLAGIQREIYRFIETGKLAEQELSRLDKLKQSAVKVFQR